MPGIQEGSLPSLGHPKRYGQGGHSAHSDLLGSAQQTVKRVELFNGLASDRGYGEDGGSNKHLPVVKAVTRRRLSSSGDEDGFGL
jgi:hypothetical protein